MLRAKVIDLSSCKTFSGERYSILGRLAINPLMTCGLPYSVRTCIKKVDKLFTFQHLRIFQRKIKFLLLHEQLKNLILLKSVPIFVGVLPQSKCRETLHEVNLMRLQKR